jgi:putative salt-induced outer membrane protein YdiY
VVSETSADTTYYDHNYTLGVSGKILSKLNGTVRVGYQLREGRGPAAADDQGFTISASTTWSLTRKANLNGQLSRDYSVTATNASVDSLNGSLDLRYTMNPRISAYGSIGGGENRFVSELTGNRVDTFLTASVGVNVAITAHIRSSLTYSYYRSWSTLDLGDFTRQSYSLNLSARF